MQTDEHAMGLVAGMVAVALGTACSASSGPPNEAPGDASIESAASDASTDSGAPPVIDPYRARRAATREYPRRRRRARSTCRLREDSKGRSTEGAVSIAGGDRSAPGSNASELQHVRHRAGALARNVRQLHAEVAHHAWGAGAAHVGGALRHRERRGRRQRLVVDALHLQPRALEQRLRHRVFDARPLRDQRHRHVSGSRGAVHG